MRNFVLRPWVWGIVLAAQVVIPGAGVRAQEDKPFHDRIERLRKERLAEELSLSKEKEAMVMEMYEEYMARERELMQKRGEIFKRLVHMSALADDVSEDKILKAIADLQDAEKRIQEHNDWLTDKMKKELKPWQLGRLILFEERFHQKMRQLMLDVKGGKGRKWKRFDAPPPLEEHIEE